MSGPITGHTETVVTKSTRIWPLSSVYQSVSDHVCLHL